MRLVGAKYLAARSCITFVQPIAIELVPEDQYDRTSCPDTSKMAEMNRGYRTRLVDIDVLMDTACKTIRPFGKDEHADVANVGSSIVGLSVT